MSPAYLLRRPTQLLKCLIFNHVSFSYTYGNKVVSFCLCLLLNLESKHPKHTINFMKLHENLFMHFSAESHSSRQLSKIQKDKTLKRLKSTFQHICTSTPFLQAFKSSFCLVFQVFLFKHLKQTFFYKVPDSKYFRICGCI